jgi:hypothetical protein
MLPPTIDRPQVAWVPGSFELPVVAKNMAASGNYAAIVTIGAVVGILSRCPYLFSCDMRHVTSRSCL